jgi:hypothetical protein
MPSLPTLPFPPVRLIHSKEPAALTSLSASRKCKGLADRDWSKRVGGVTAQEQSGEPQLLFGNVEDGVGSREGRADGRRLESLQAKRLQLLPESLSADSQDLGSPHPLAADTLENLVEVAPLHLPDGVI